MVASRTFGATLHDTGGKMGKQERKVGGGEAGRFDQKNTAYSRIRWDPSLEDLSRSWYAERVLKDKPAIP